MAAQEFITRMTARSMQIAFNRAVNFAIEEEGNGMYNGTISTCETYQDVTQEFKHSTLDKLSFIDKKLETANKRECFCITELEPLTNTNKIRSTVEHNVIKGTSKWELQYNVYTGWDDRQLKSCKTKGEAVEIARKHTEQTKDTTFIRMEKILVNQDPNVAVVRYKQSSSEREGTYVFFGLAAI